MSRVRASPIILTCRTSQHAQAKGHWIVDTPIANPMSVYEAYKGSRKSWGIDALGTVVCEVELFGGQLGVGISIGGRFRRLDEDTT